MHSRGRTCARPPLGGAPPGRTGRGRAPPPGGLPGMMWHRGIRQNECVAWTCNTSLWCSTGSCAGVLTWCKRWWAKHGRRGFCRLACRALGARASSHPLVVELLHPILHRAVDLSSSTTEMARYRWAASSNSTRAHDDHHRAILIIIMMIT